MAVWGPESSDPFNQDFFWEGCFRRCLKLTAQVVPRAKNLEFSWAKRD